MRQKSSASVALTTSDASRALQQLLEHAPELVTSEQRVRRCLGSSLQLADQICGGPAFPQHPSLTVPACALPRAHRATAAS